MEYRMVLSENEILALDHYFTHRAGWIGHEDEADLAAHSLADVIAVKAAEIRKEDENDSNR